MPLKSIKTNVVNEIIIISRLGLPNICDCMSYTTTLLYNVYLRFLWNFYSTNGLALSFIDVLMSRKILRKNINSFWRCRLTLLWQSHLYGWAVIVAQLVDRPLPNTRGPQFESSHRRIFIKNHLFTHCQLHRKDKNKRKRGRDWPI